MAKSESLDVVDEERDVAPLERPSVYCDNHKTVLARKYVRATETAPARRLCADCCAAENIPLYGVKVKQ